MAIKSLSSVFKSIAEIFYDSLVDGPVHVIAIYMSLGLICACFDHDTLCFIEKICFHVLDGLQTLIHVAFFVLGEICAFLLCVLQVLIWVTIFSITSIIILLVILIIVENVGYFEPGRELLSFARFLDSKIKAFEGKAFEAMKTMYSMAVHNFPHLTFYIIAILFCLQYGGIKLFAFLFVTKCCLTRQARNDDRKERVDVMAEEEEEVGEARARNKDEESGDDEENHMEESIDDDEADSEINSRNFGIDCEKDGSIDDDEERSRHGSDNDDDGEESSKDGPIDKDVKYEEDEVNSKGEKNVAEDKVNLDNDKDEARGEVKSEEDGTINSGKNEAYETRTADESMDNHDSRRTTEEWILIEEGVAKLI